VYEIIVAHSTQRRLGSPWVTNASIVGRVTHNRNEKIRYVVDKCDPARLVSDLGHSYDSGFVSHRTIRFVDRKESGTHIEIDYYSVGSPNSIEVGAKFVRWLTERWIYGFARFCEEHRSTCVYIIQRVAVRTDRFEVWRRSSRREISSMSVSTLTPPFSISIICSTLNPACSPATASFPTAFINDAVAIERHPQRAILCENPMQG